MTNGNKRAMKRERERRIQKDRKAIHKTDTDVTTDSFGESTQECNLDQRRNCDSQRTIQTLVFLLKNKKNAIQGKRLWSLHLKNRLCLPFTPDQTLLKHSFVRWRKTCLSIDVVSFCNSYSSHFLILFLIIFDTLC